MWLSCNRILLEVSEREIMTGVWIMSALSSSCTPRCVNWPTCCQWTVRWDRGWTLWLENSPKQLIKNYRCCFSPSHPSAWFISAFLIWWVIDGGFVQVIVDSMVSLCRELCPLSCAAAECLSPPLSSISERVSIPRSSIRTALMERAAQDINRALE